MINKIPPILKKTKNHFSPQLTEQEKEGTTIYDIGDTGPGFGQTPKYGRVKPVNVILTLTSGIFVLCYIL